MSQGESQWVTREYVDKFGLYARQALRVKIRSLAAESRIIRHEKGKYPGGSSVHGVLNHHRINDVRFEARAAQLAYAYLRGCRTYRQTEPSCRTDRFGPSIERVRQIVKKFGMATAIEGLDAWFSAK